MVFSVATDVTHNSRKIEGKNAQSDVIVVDLFSLDYFVTSSSTIYPQK